MVYKYKVDIAIGDVQFSYNTSLKPYRPFPTLADLRGSPQ